MLAQGPDSLKDRIQVVSGLSGSLGHTTLRLQHNNLYTNVHYSGRTGSLFGAFAFGYKFSVQFWEGHSSVVQMCEGDCVCIFIFSKAFILDNVARQCLWRIIGFRGRRKGVGAEWMFSGTICVGPLLGDAEPMYISQTGEDCVQCEELKLIFVVRLRRSYVRCPCPLVNKTRAQNQKKKFFFDFSSL